MRKDLTTEQIDNVAFIGRCVKGIAHNINTPLSAIMGRAEMLQMRLQKINQTLSSGWETGDDLEKCIRDIGLIIENSMRVSDTVKNAMQKSINVESMKVQSLNIGRILHEELLFYNADMEYKHNIDKEIDIEERIPAIQGVFVHFSNSIVEILDNSIRAVRDSTVKRIAVRVGADDRAIRVCFHDTGCGIPAPLQEDIRTVFASGAMRVSDGLSTGGMVRVAKLLKPYNPAYRLLSEPGSTELEIAFPIAQ